MKLPSAVKNVLTIYFKQRWIQFGETICSGSLLKSVKAVGGGEDNIPIP